jgi:hypothetical protein
MPTGRGECSLEHTHICGVGGVGCAPPPTHTQLLCACRCLKQLAEWSGYTGLPGAAKAVDWGLGTLIFSNYLLERSCQIEGRFLPLLLTAKEMTTTSHRQKLHNQVGALPGVVVSQHLLARAKSNMLVMLERCKWAPPAPVPPPVRLVQNGKALARAARAPRCGAPSRMGY